MVKWRSGWGLAYHGRLTHFWQRAGVLARDGITLHHRALCGFTVRKRYPLTSVLPADARPCSRCVKLWDAERPAYVRMTEERP